MHASYVSGTALDVAYTRIWLAAWPGRQESVLHERSVPASWTLETVLNAAHIKIMAGSLARQAGVFDVHSCLRMPAGSPETAVVAAHIKIMAGSLARQADKTNRIQPSALASYIRSQLWMYGRSKHGWQLGQAAVHARELDLQAQSVM